MFKNVLSVEDYESASISVQKALEELQVKNQHFVNYCDQGLELAKNSLKQNDPIELLITDLSFDEDHKEQEINGGYELIIEIRKLLPEIKVIVFSSEKRPQIINALFSELQINGFVSKARKDVEELKKSIGFVYNNERHLSQENLNSIRNNDTIELSTIEYHILKFLSEGISQKNMQKYLIEKKLKPNGLSSIEKILNQLKDNLQAKSNEHLIAISKDLGIL